jgi:aspartate kinase
VTQARPIVVMKFGGTSVAGVAGREAIARRVLAAQELGQAPVLVVSAMGRAGDPYSTDTLLGLVADLPADARERDLLASTGESVAAVVVAHELRAAGVQARAFTGAEAGIATDSAHGAASITEIHAGAVLSAVEAGLVPVVAGFQGVADDGSVTTLGRGGSDTTACALGVALGADSVEIYTDVDGIMSADPRSCDGAGVLEIIRADELHQMAQAGAKVVHAPAAELALASGLKVRVRNTYSEHPGTLVADIASYVPTTVATAVTKSAVVARVRVDLGAGEGQTAHMSAQTRVFRAMADAGVSLDMFTPAGDALLFTVPESALPDVSGALEALGLTCGVTEGLAKVTLVGAAMHGVPGVMARMAEHLDAAGVDVLQAADSHTTISVLVNASDADTAVRALHDGFELAG